MPEVRVAMEAHGRKVDFFLDLDPLIQPDSFLLEHFKRGICYEPETAWILFRVLREGDTAIDVGANIGFFTMFMSRLVGETGKVIACEPGSNNLPTLRNHVSKNAAFNVEIIDKPVWSCVEPVTFYLNSDARSSNALFDPGNWWENYKSRENPQPVQMVSTTLDELTVTSGDRPVRLIKIDTEGAEQRILEGAANLLEKQHPPYIVAELNPHGLIQSGCDGETFREMMRSFGYDMFFIHPDDHLPSLVFDAVKVKFVNGVVITNALFSTMEHVAAAWPEAIG